MGIPHKQFISKVIALLVLFSFMEVNSLSANMYDFLCHYSFDNYDP